jgi:hypothetical protein
MGAGLGGVAGGGAAALLSPNSESVALNAVVFGSLSALAGGTLFLITSHDSKVPNTSSSIQARELSDARASHLYVVPNNQKLPDFVKDRYQPAVVEEVVEPDSVSEDGSLHEPHKAYRIQRNAELFSGRPEPAPDGSGNPEK